MKATLEFNLPEEAVDHIDAVNGTDWKLVAWDLDQLLRNYIKYGSCDQCEDNRYSAFEHIRNELHSIIETKGLVLDS
jgi:hypothetical protein